MRLQGPRLTLTALGAEELRKVRWAPDDEDARTMFLERLRDDPDARGWWVWVAARSDGVEVGNGGFGGRPGPNRRLTVGYSVHEEYRRRGYATEILTLLADWALARPEVDLVRVTIRPDNLASLRVAEKAGFAATGELEHDQEQGDLIVLERRGAALRGR
ncbi:MAG TPA: GNAT family N-acetyltransferase [Gaiellaceae bacterium]|nr:GNAT family N-acetyltransferase [Gaiellaceae bacterium]